MTPCPDAATPRQPGAPPRSVYKLQAAVLAEVKTGAQRAKLRRVEAVRVTDEAGREVQEPWGGLQPEPRDEAAEAAALAALAALRLRSHKDSLPCRVAEGLYIGGAGAARNLKALRKRGITAVVNAAPSVPCYFRDNPEGAFTYLALPLFDDPEADLAPHIEACDAFIGAARARGGAVLVHCYAGQSRSAALVVAHLMAGGRGLSLMDAWALVRRARPCAQPNSGFLRQLAALGKSLAAAAAGPAAEQPALQDSALALDAAR